MILAVPKSKVTENICRDDEEGSFKSQIEHSHLDVLTSSALKYIRKEDSVVVSISEGIANVSFVIRILDTIIDSGCEDVMFLIRNDKLIKSITKKGGKRGRRINIMRGSLLDIESDLGTANVILDICSVQHCLSKDSNRILESDAHTIFSNIAEILKDGGRYLCMMDAEEKLISKMLSYFKDNWFIRFKCFQMSAKSAERSLDIYSPLALLTLTKLKLKLPKPVLEIATRTDKAKRVAKEDDVREELYIIWSYSHLQLKLRKEFDLANTHSIDYWCPKTNSESPRYTVHIVDTAKDDLNQYSGKYGIFIVPIGREISWLFASIKGRCDLAKMAGFERLAVISTHRGHLYGDLEEVQQELSLKVLQLAPPGLSASTKVPFVTVGDDIGKRDVVFESGSDFDGHIVEDFKMDDGFFYRRLIFKKSPALVQSEFRILNDTVGNGLSFEQRRMDLHYLVGLYHRRMVATLSLIEEVKLTSHLKILLIGLGGGALASFITSAFVNATVFCVEIDYQIVDIAKKWFCLSEDSNVKTVIADGLEFMTSESERGTNGHYDAILFDVNTDDDSMAITGPPMAFLEDSVLDNVSQLLKPAGVFTMNFVCRDVNIRMDAISRLKTIFKHVKLFHGDDDELNVVVTCLSPERPGPLPSNAECLRLLSDLTGRISEDDSSDPLGFSDIISSSNAI